jgi:hypothetical protein
MLRCRISGETRGSAKIHYGNLSVKNVPLLPEGQLGRVARKVGGGVSIASMIALLIRCLLRLPWWIVSASSMPILIQRLTVVWSTRSRCATSPGVKYSCSILV